MIWFRKYVFQFRAGKQETIQHIQSTLASGRWRKLVATFSEEGIKIHHKLPPLFHNSWNPIFVGRFIPSASGTKLVGYFRVNWLVFGFIIIFLGMCLFQLYDAWLQPEVIPGKVVGWREKSISFELQFIGFFALINIVGWAIGIPYQRRMIAAIKESAEDA